MRLIAAGLGLFKRSPFTAALTLALLLILAGAFGIEDRLSAETSPTATDCGALVSGEVTASWMSLEACIPDFENVLVASRKLGPAGPERLYLPLYPAGVNRDRLRAQLVLATDSPELLALMARAREELSTVTAAEIVAIVRRWKETPLEVHVPRGLNATDRKALSDLSGVLSVQPVLLRAGPPEASAPIGSSIAALVLGCVIAAFVVSRLRRQRIIDASLAAPLSAEDLYGGVEPQLGELAALREENARAASSGAPKPPG